MKLVLKLKIITIIIWSLQIDSCKSVFKENYEATSTSQSLNRNLVDCSHVNLFGSIDIDTFYNKLRFFLHGDLKKSK